MSQQEINQLIIAYNLNEYAIANTSNEVGKIKLREENDRIELVLKYENDKKNNHLKTL